MDKASMQAPPFARVPGPVSFHRCICFTRKTPPQHLQAVNFSHLMLLHCCISIIKTLFLLLILHHGDFNFVQGYTNNKVQSLLEDAPCVPSHVCMFHSLFCSSWQNTHTQLPNYSIRSHCPDTALSCLLLQTSAWIPDGSACCRCCRVSDREIESTHCGGAFGIQQSPIT